MVERSLAWMMNARPHARDYERLVQHSEALITWAAITLMTRRITQKKKLSPSTLVQAACLRHLQPGHRPHVSWTAQIQASPECNSDHP